MDERGPDPNKTLRELEFSSLLAVAFLALTTSGILVLGLALAWMLL
jgi:hypothetical protein